MAYADFPSPPTVPITPFRLSIPDKDIADLTQLIGLSRIPKETYENVTAEEHKFGVTREWLVKTKDAWASFDWRKQEDRINKQPQFTAKVQDSDGRDYDIHFAALFSKKKDAIPMILSHGWPGCYLEFLPLMELLRGKYSEQDLPFHLIFPTLPGWLFSTPPPIEREFGVKDVGILFDKLMKGLGFGAGYIAQGGDIGSYVTNELGKRHDACKIVHVNYRNLSNPPPGVQKAEGLPDYTPDDMMKWLQSYGYALEHSTRPSTVGLAIGSSPIALLAWIGEKYLAWSDKDPSEETILTIVSLYWFTDCFASSLYTYRYGMGIRRNLPRVEMEYQPCPTGFSLFPKELAPTPVKWVKEVANVVWSREHDAGGHFAALELPEVLWKDITDFVEENWEKYK
ncbi:hypothetical protein IAT38_003745 [Cryptococcus sp. DSM 104549]